MERVRATKKEGTSYSKGGYEVLKESVRVTKQNVRGTEKGGYAYEFY